MAYELVHRGRRSDRRVDRDEECDRDQEDRQRERVRSSAWGSLGIDRGSGSPEIADHAAMHLLIDAYCARIVGSISAPVSHRTIRWETLSGPRSRTVEAPTSSTRYGTQRFPERNLRCYLYCEVLGMSLSEAGRRLAMKKQAARKAKRMGARLAGAFATTRPDPRKVAW